MVAWSLQQTLPPGPAFSMVAEEDSVDLRHNFAVLHGCYPG